MSDIDGPTVKINADASGVDSAIQHVTQQIETLQTQAAGIGGKFEAMGASMSKMGMGLTAGITAPMTVAVASIGAMTQQAANFQSQMAEVFTLMPGLGKEAMGQMSDDVKAFSSEFGIMSEQVVPALYQAISAGVPSDNVFSFLEVAAKSSIGGVTDLETAVDGLTTVMNSYTNDQVSAERAADAMFTAAKLGKTNFEELSQSMYQATPMANALGVSIEDVAAAFATLTAQGTPTNVSATQMKALFKELLDPASELSKYLDEVTEGADFKQLSDSGKSLFDVISILNNGLKEDGKQWTEVTGSIEASQAGMVLSSEMMGNFTNQMKDASGAVDEAYKTMSESAVQQMNKVKAELHNMVIDIGESFLPILQNDIMPILKDDLVPYIQNTVVPAIKGFADWFSNLDDRSKKAVAGVGIFAAALGPLMMLLGPIVSGGGSLITALSTIGTVAKGAQLTGVATGISGLGTAAGGATPALAALFGPAGILAIGLGAGALAAYSANLGGFRDNINEVFDSLGNAVINIDKGNYKQAGKDVAEAFGQGFEAIVDLAAKGGPQILQQLNQIQADTRPFALGIGEAIGDAISGGLSSADASVRAAGAALATAASTGFNEVKADPVQFVSDLLSGIQGREGEFQTSGYGLGESVMTGFESAINTNMTVFDTLTLNARQVMLGITQSIAGISDEQLNAMPDWYKSLIGYSEEASDDVQKFERAVAKSLQNAGTEVKTFADKSSADLNNAMSKWQDAFEKSGQSLEEWTESLKKSGDYSQFIADMDAFAAKYPELADKAGGAANVMKQLDFKPVQFEDGSILYAYENGVLQPITNKPIKIMMELNDYENDMRSAYEIYLDYKSQIENAPIMVQMMTSGDVNTSDTSAWKWVADDPNSKGRNIPGETTTTATPDNKSANQNTDAQNKNTESNNKNTEQVSELYKQFKDWDTYQNKYMLQNKGASIDAAIAAYENDKRIASQSSGGSQSSQSDNTKATSDNTSATRKSTEAKTDEQKASEAYNKKIQDAIHQMGKWDIQDKYDKREIESNTPNMMDYDSIDAYNKAVSANSDKLNRLTDSRAEKEELLAYDLGITVEELRNLAAGNKNVTSSGEKLVSTFNTIANIDFSKLTNPFAPQQTGTGTPLSDAELTAIMRAKMPYASESDFAGIVSQQGGIKALAKSWGIIDESGRRIGEYTSETTNKLEKSSELLKSVSDIIGDDLSPGFDRATKYIEEFKKITGDDTDYSDGNQKTLALLLNAYKDASDLQDKYEDVLSDSNYSLDEQRDITDKYNDILRLVGLTGIDTTQSLEGLPPAIRAIVEAIMALVNGVKVNSDTRTSGLETPDKKPNKSYIGEIDAESDALFKKIQQDFKNVQSSYDSGKLSQAEYLKQLKELSVEADILSHDPSALKGSQREAIQRFEETIQEQFRRDYAGTGAKGIKNYNPDASLKSAINDLNSQTYPIGKSIKETGTEAKPRYEDEWNKQELNDHVAKQYTDAIKGLNENLKSGKITTDQYKDHVNTLNEWQKSIKDAYSGVGEVLEADKAHLESLMKSAGITTQDVKGALNAAKTTTPQINTLNSAFEKIGLTGSGLTDVLANVNQSLSDHHANILESKDYLTKYNDAAGENVKYSKEQEGQTKDLMNSLGMLGTAQDMYNNYMSDGVLDATEASHVQQALAAATKMMGDAGIDANTNLAGLPGALQALASAAQAAMSQIQSAIAMANAQISNVRKVGDWTLQTMTGLPTIANPTPTNFKFASGGPVTQNGPAYLHQGEYVLRRDEVNKLTSGSPNVNLNINMSNSRFGNSEMQKDLPKRIARETRRALARSGI